MNQRHVKTLELPKILEKLSSYTSFSGGGDRARELAPSSIISEIRERLEETSEARALLESKPQTTLGGARDVRPQVEAARRGVTLVPVDLLDLQGTLQAARTLRNALTRLSHQFPRLADMAARIAPCEDLSAEITRCIDERAQVRDDASPELGRIRRELTVTHDRLLERLQRIISSPNNAGYLQESIITQREGRYVVPLKSEFKGRIRGIVHDRSASGATLFIEPMAIVDMGNNWRELQIQEEQEVHRILASLSARVAYHGAEIEHTVEALADLDLTFAKAKYADAIEATAPTLVPFEKSEDTPHPGVTVNLVQARHPLIDPEQVVPIDLVLDEDTHILVITGPNTGGKTVTLKTTGLLILMAQSGLHIPVAAGSSFSPFDTVYADIGDEQSIEQSLSTFSAHLTNILSFIDKADARSLVLLDELGAGTDPTEGAALAHALLEWFRERSVTTFVATHYPELKAYAQLTPGVRNASVEFDSETLQPTYRLSIGLPGRSNAFAIASRLGLRDEIVRVAEGMISREDRRTEDLLADIHQLRLQAARERDRTHAARLEAVRTTEELKQRLINIDQERNEILEEARAEARSELESLREEMRQLRQRLEAAAVPARELGAVESEIEDLENAVAEEPEPLPLPTPPSRPIRVGDQVRVAQLGTEGQVLALENGEAEVQVGPARTKVDLEQLELLGAAEPEPEPSGTSYHIPSVSTNINLRGFTVEDALQHLDRHLDDASLAGLPWVHIVHGKGTGALRKAVREFLRSHPLIESYRSGEEGEGGEGVTIATLVSS